MGRIKILDESVANIIAAGEVVENPASMIKELLENSLDANSTYIKIEVKSGGRYVKINDNGDGMDEEDLLLSVERHATSKISTKEDLYNLFTYGFRGEALSSIGAVSKMTISSKKENIENGNLVAITGGKITNLKECSMGKGTEIEIKELFFNTPARLKFLRKANTEYGNIKDIVIREALSNPEVSIVLVIENKEVFRTSGRGMENAILDIFGRNTLKNLKKFKYGYLGNISLVKSNKDSIYIFVNGRPVKSKIVEKAILDGYYTKLMKGKYPFALIFLKLDPKTIDINVHPSKKIVKFEDEENIYNLILEEINLILKEDEEFVTFNYSENPKNEEKHNFLDFENYILEPKKIDFSVEKEKKSLTDLKEYSNLKEEKNIKENFLIEEKEIKSFKKKSYRIIGQYSKSFILVEEDNDLILYDQHIVHERILYEKFKKEYSKKKIESQQLLVPIRIEVTIKERDLIVDNIDLLREFSFEIDEFNQNEFLIRAVPNMDFKESIENTFRSLLEDLKNIRGNGQVLIENMIITMACKGAIKAHEYLPMGEMEILLDKLHEIGEYTCPHGRPIRFKLTLDDVEKGFKRK
ncbi:DNA mismatch repair protein MutL [Cetobacterium ceti]|uniref:DNA mismatch repair protein MutL n=1 Tax=Cetobacterium ceti TaxID=180163 RepID=A0A1T4KMI4_9FUSO|nr:DNA mismatch repair endonuclease MutL [Cetobacterium ceti]SJZ43616.1 DNA mismatch repair protein MutL [Cetobacterium ceti]